MSRLGLRPILSLGLNELLLTWKDKTALMWMVLMPILFILFFGYVGTGGGSPGHPIDRSACRSWTATSPGCRGP